MTVKQSLVVHSNCRHYRGAYPCLPNKARQRVCGCCPEHDPVSHRILMIKLGAPGDVLRTTSLLAAIHAQWPKSELTWLTRRSAVELLENIPQIDRVLTVEEEGVLQLQGERFDLGLNLDNEPLACSLASQLNLGRVMGFTLDDLGRIVGTSAAAARWLELALFDQEKQANEETYQAHMRAILGVPVNETSPIRVNLRTEETEQARSLLGERELSRPVVFNTGAGARWPSKVWPQQRFIDLARRFQATTGEKVLLVGGPLEDKLNRDLADSNPNLFVYLGVQPLRVFMALVSECRLLVTADSLALHVALGTQTPVVALFGPTSAAEIEPSGPLLKLTAEQECLCCYNKTCHQGISCMSALSPTMVWEALEETGWHQP